MNNTQYIEKILSSVDRILVDTSTLMVEGFQQFISDNKKRILDEAKRIVVSKAVYGELARLVESSNAEKSNLATSALELLALNKDVFQVEDSPLTEEEIAHAFADKQLLAELTLHRTNYTQLLITNDRKLSCDAYALNEQQSCKGRRVWVCYINGCGKLQCCDCARPSTEKTFNEPPLTISITPDKNYRDTSRVASKEKEDAPWKFDWKSSLLTAAGLVMSYGVYKGARALIRNKM